MALDERLRAHLRKLGEAEVLERGEPASSEAIAAGVRRRQARSRANRLGLGLGLVAAAALAAVTWLRLETSESHLASTSKGAGRTPAPNVHAAAPTPPPVTALCNRALPSWVERGKGVAVAEVPDEVRWVRGEGTRGRLAWEGACDHAMRLEAGSIAVHASNLGGKHLRVHTPLGDVSVVGTAFEVVFDAGELSVRVVEGTVEVALAGGTRRVHAGQVLRAGRGTSVRVLPARAAGDLRARLGLVEPGIAPAPPRPPPLALPATAPAAAGAADQAERIWRPGAPDVQPPGYEPAGSSAQPDGRPMKKPRVIR